MATTTKIQSDCGAKVTTIVSANKATAGDPASLTLEVGANGKAGFTWGDGGVIVKLVKNGLAEKSKVSLDYRLAAVNRTKVTNSDSKSDIESLLIGARKSKKKYTVTFSLQNRSVVDAPEITGAAEDIKLTPISKDSVALDEEKQVETHNDVVEVTGSPSGGLVVFAETAKAPEQLEAEEMAKRFAEEAAAAESKRIEEERLATLKSEEDRLAEIDRIQKLRNGKVAILYNMYADEFDLVNGTLDASVVDEEYCLSDAMPGCHIHLSKISPEEFTKLSQPSELGSNFIVKYELEEPWGKFQDLETRRRYYVWVVQDPKQEEKDRLKMKSQWQTLDDAVKELEEKDSRGEGIGGTRLTESCSCIEGNPCVDPYICLDWYNRIAVAKQHGYKAGAELKLF